MFEICNNLDISFEPGIPFLGIFGPKNQNCLFMREIGTQTNSNMLKSVVMLTCPALDGEYAFSEKFALKN